MLNIAHYYRKASQNYNEVLNYNGLTPVRMAIIKMSTNNKCWEGVEKIFLHCWWEYKLIQPLWRAVWRVLKNLGIKLSYDPTIPLLGIYPEKTITEKDTHTPMFIAALFTIARTWGQPIYQQMNR